MITFRLLNENPLYDYREACKITQGITMGDKEKNFKPKDEVEYWIKQIVARHSTIRTVTFVMNAEAPKSVVMQIIRATKGAVQPFVQSSRPDWTGKERSNDPYELKMFMQKHTAESFVEMAKQRLCNRTEARTRKFMNEAVKVLKDSDVPFFKALGFCCHPACWWLGSCPEIKSCNEDMEKTSDIIISNYRCEEKKECLTLKATEK